MKIIDYVIILIISIPFISNISYTREVNDIKNEIYNQIIVNSKNYFDKDIEINNLREGFINYLLNKDFFEYFDKVNFYIVNEKNKHKLNNGYKYLIFIEFNKEVYLANDIEQYNKFINNINIDLDNNEIIIKYLEFIYYFFDKDMYSFCDHYFSLYNNIIFSANYEYYDYKINNKVILEQIEEITIPWIIKNDNGFLIFTCSGTLNTGTIFSFNDIKDIKFYKINLKKNGEIKELTSISYDKYYFFIKNNYKKAYRNKFNLLTKNRQNFITNISKKYFKDFYIDKYSYYIENIEKQEKEKLITNCNYLYVKEISKYYLNYSYIIFVEYKNNIYFLSGIDEYNKFIIKQNLLLNSEKEIILYTKYLHKIFNLKGKLFFPNEKNIKYYFVDLINIISPKTLFRNNKIEFVVGFPKEFDGFLTGNIEDCFIFYKFLIKTNGYILNIKQIDYQDYKSFLSNNGYDLPSDDIFVGIE